MNRKCVFFLIIYPIIFCSCVPAKITETIIPTSTATVAVPPSFSPTLKLTATKRPTWTPFPTLTFTATSQPTFTRKPPLTPFPTHSSYYENVHAFEQLYATNAGCDLPCWWGITPGITTWEETMQFINRFRDSNSVDKIPTNASTSYIWHSYAPNIDYAPTVFFEVKDSLVESIYVPGEMVQHQFSLHVILGKIGIPSEIYIGPTQNQLNDSESTSITAYVLYKDLHVMDIIQLFGATQNQLFVGKIVNNYLSPCEFQRSGEELFLWAPGSELISRLPDILRYKTIG